MLLEWCHRRIKVIIITAVICTIKTLFLLRKLIISYFDALIVSTQSTGDSVDEDEKGEMETRRNTSHNEVIDEDNPQTPEEVRVGALRPIINH